MLDTDLERLLAHELNSFAHWDLLRYFLGDGHDSATLDELALASGRDAESLLAVAGALVSRGWLSRRVEPGSGQTAYWLTQEQSRQEQLERLRVALGQRDAMIKAMRLWSEASVGA